MRHASRSGPRSRPCTLLPRHRALPATVLGLWLALGSAGAAVAAGTVTTCATFGPGAGTLADALAGGGTVSFACSGTIVVPEIAITTDTTIDATGQTVTLSGGNANRVFAVSGARLELIALMVTAGASSFNGGAILADTGSTLELTETTVSASTATWWGGGIALAAGAGATLSGSEVTGNSARYGGGIYADAGATLILTNSTVSGNSVTYPGASGYGGGLFAGPGATLTLRDSTLSGNTAGGAHPAGGGIYAAGDEGSVPAVTLIRSTLKGNSARYGGGLFAGTGAVVGLTNSTVSGNSAASWGGGLAAVDAGTALNLAHSTVASNTSVSGGGIMAESSSVSLTSSIVAMQAAGTDCFNGGAATFVSGGYNLDSDSTCGLGAAGDLPGANPLLLALAGNGGPTETHALGGGSPALDRIPAGANGCGTTVATDQRGTDRPQNGKCDIGAFERTVTETDLLGNGSFEIDVEPDGKPDGWTAANLNVRAGEGRVCDTASAGDCSVRMDAGAKPNKLFQEVPYSGASGNAFTLTLAEKASGIAGATVYRAVVQFFNGGTLKKTVKLELPADTHDWTPRVTAFSGPAGPYTKVKVMLVFTKTSGTGTAWFDNLRLRAY